MFTYPHFFNHMTHDQNDWAWDQGDSEWDGTTDRAAKNMEKKKKERRNAKIENAAHIGRGTISLGPIKDKSLQYFNKIIADYSEAKKMATAELMTGYLKYDHQDMSDLYITDTKSSSKGDDILYVVMSSPEKVLNIRGRIADVQNAAIKTI